MRSSNRGWPPADPSSQKRAEVEQALRDKDQRFRDIVETSPDWIWEVDAEGRYVFSSGAVKNMLGYQPNSLLGKSYLELVHPDDRLAVEQAYERMKREGYGMTGIVARWRTKSGDYRWLEKNALPLLEKRAGLKGYRGTDRDITERRVHELTGLPNRSLFCEHINGMLPNLAAQGLPLIVLVFDLEHLTTLNDSLGRQVGDRLLQRVAARMRVLLGDTRSMAHLGGGSFAVVFTEVVDAQDAAYILRNEISRLFAEPFDVDGQSIRLTAKSGLSRYPQDGTEPEVLLQRAEAALRRAKDSGEKYLHYKLQMNSQLMERLAMESRLECALAQDQFVLYYQPTVSLRTGRIESAEALIRWNDPTLGMVAPGRFISILESTSMILEVGEWALKQAASQLSQWRERGLPPLRIAVNVSPVQLKRSEFVPSVLSVLGRGTLKSVDLDLEITESMLMGDMDASVCKLQRLREAGVGIALDDFGTGFSSLSRLAKLPIDTLKVDGSFVSEIVSNHSLRAVVTTIVSLAKAFDMRAVAEGVETPQQLELLRKLGCDSLQGYLISPPVPAHEFEALFLEKGGRVDLPEL